MAKNENVMVVEDHRLDYRDRRYECTRCGVSLLSAMQFQGRECRPKSAPAPVVGPPDDTEVGALASALSDPHLPPDQAIYPWGEKARQVLDSDWLAARERAAEERGARAAFARLVALADRWQRIGDEGLQHRGCLGMYQHCAAELRSALTPSADDQRDAEREAAFQAHRKAVLSREPSDEGGA